MRISDLNQIVKYYSSRLICKVLPQLNLSGSLESSAVDALIISPYFKTKAISPFYKKKHEKRIIGGVNLDVKGVLKTLNRKEIEFKSAILYRLKDVLFLNGSIYYSNNKIDLRHVKEHNKRDVFSKNKLTEIPRASLIDSCAGSTWFGHWLEDSVPSQLLTVNCAEGVGFERRPYHHENRYREIFGLPNRCQISYGIINELFYFDEFAQNPNKTLRYLELRRRVRQHFKNHQGEKRVFLKRGTSGVTRELINEEGLGEYLQKEGYICVDITSPLDDLLSILIDADVVVSTEGSHLAHCLYSMKKNSTLIILAPPYLVHTTVADIGIFNNIHSGIFVCQLVDMKKGTFSVDIQELMCFVDSAIKNSQTEKNLLNSYLNEIYSLNKNRDDFLAPIKESNFLIGP